MEAKVEIVVRDNMRLRQFRNGYCGFWWIWKHRRISTKERRVVDGSEGRGMLLAGTFARTKKILPSSCCTANCLRCRSCRTAQGRAVPCPQEGGTVQGGSRTPPGCRGTSRVPLETKRHAAMCRGTIMLGSRLSKCQL
ncbi:hypothetical protein ACMD2_21333 [Ananas comosus]|uniref:Uncharacterized protein n=1 Tax=Ananas comosus TaxID=4615 RepID=A0A199VX98_ANACO|nr:hypothetical protein ACMD2_21333 [Ananas comosus]